jgi:hypothetical protein
VIRLDGDPGRRADAGGAIGVPDGGAPAGMIGLPVGPSGGDAAPWFRMIRPVNRNHLDDLRLVSRMSDRYMFGRVLSPAPLQCNDTKAAIGASGDVGVGLAYARRESHS